MTDWAYNILTVSGSAADLRRLEAAVTDSEESLDFRAIVPVPEGTSAFAFVDLRADLIAAPDYTPASLAGYWGCSGEPRAHGNLCRDPMPDGTPALRWTFETPGAAPRRLVQALSEQYPDIAVELYYDEGAASSWGVMRHVGGEVDVEIAEEFELVLARPMTAKTRQESIDNALSLDHSVVGIVVDHDPDRAPVEGWTCTTRGPAVRGSSPAGPPRYDLLTCEAVTHALREATADPTVLNRFHDERNGYIWDAAYALYDAVTDATDWDGLDTAGACSRLAILLAVVADSPVTPTVQAAAATLYASSDLELLRRVLAEMPHRNLAHASAQPEGPPDLSADDFINAFVVALTGQDTP